MRVINFHRHEVPAATELPDVARVYETALESLDGSHETDAAACLACCRVEIVPARGDYPLREELQPVRLILSGSGSTMSLLERSPEIRGRIRQALDNALGPTVYLAQMALSTCANSLAA
jgi:hypothetical protein